MSGGGIDLSVVRPRIGVLSVLALYILLLVCVPAQLIVGPLGKSGTPALLLGMGCLVWWVIGRVDARLGLRSGHHPLRVIYSMFLGAMACSYVVAAMRVAQPAEVRSADRTVLSLAAGAGVLLLATDGLRTRADLDRLLRWMSLGAGVLAILGLIQFFLGIEVATYIKVPGLVPNDAAQLIQQRSVFRRVAGTASHPIEFGVALTMLFPIATHCAFTAVRNKRLHWAIVAMVAAAIPMSISRSAMLGFAVAWLVLLCGWESRRRMNAILLTPIALMTMRLMIPGLLGTIRSLFANLSSDPSYVGRTDDYDFVGRFIREAPVLGRGLGTFIPDLYTTLDNQYLGQIVETGYVGLSALLLLFVGGCVLAWRIRRGGGGDQRSLGTALCAAITVPLVTFVTFDGMSFSMVTGFVFLVLGCTGAAWRLYVEPYRHSAGTLATTTSQHLVPSVR